MMKFELTQRKFSIPSNTNSEGSLRPVSAFYDGHLAPHVAAGAVENLVGVSMISRCIVVGMAAAAVFVGVGMRHGEGWNKEYI